jgi:hypothetical protein
LGSNDHPIIPIPTVTLTTTLTIILIIMYKNVIIMI